ncbi:hypothetical protein FHR24_002022 [Wenyingzhuangia heitensis]|uniref:Uncharacterized protein n=1 Tax=Wenyingzhuangia heitensis TaxID=1487859 RepID=A0ABX0U9Q2_9FLAO|nr:hypothetical protein [Wenyingzhuangia heitensis]NIJ45554.1 hypothetical protein [Wenyingzhuangia heitensis]
MEKVKNKLLIGFLFSVITTLANSLFKYHSDFFNLVSGNIKSIGFNFIIFFLIGYVVLGNILVAKKES